MKTLPAFLVLFLSLGISAQDNHSIRDDLRFYADAMVNTDKAEHRLRAGNEFYSRFREYVYTSESWSDRLRDLPWITVVAPADSTFRIITWQVKEETSFHYYGFIQFPDSPEHTAIELVDSRPLNSEYASFRPDQWYGAIYYGIQDFRTSDDVTEYILLGFNAYTEILNQRMADILRITDFKASFGIPVFEESDTTDAKSRIIVEYADAAAATMLFDREKELLIYDNVIPINTPEGTTMVPDGSYHAFSYKEGTMKFIDKVFNTISDEPPGGRPKEAVKRDLFGRPTENRRE